MKLLESNNILSFISNIKKYSSTTSSYYVGKSKVQHYWSQNCCELEKMYPKGKFIVLLDDEPILQNVKESDILKTRLVKYDFDDITMKFKEYGLQIINDNTVFLDVLLPEKEGYDYKPLIGLSMPLKKPELNSGINFNEIKNELAKDLGGYCLPSLISRWTMESTIEKNYLSKFELLFRWHKTYIKCPSCGDVLIKKLSKVSCICSNCNQKFYPTINPISMTFVIDKTNEYCLLINPLNTSKNIFTLIHTFSNPGESIEESARRGIARRIGIECNKLKLFVNFHSQPSIDNCLLFPFYCVIDKNIILNDASNEIGSAKWFSRKEIIEAINMTYNDSLCRVFSLSTLENIIKNRIIDIEKDFYYIPPPGSLSYSLIKMWAEHPDVFFV
ncbi:NUDIX hydrolase domain and NUDIX hydrolase domain-like-containing protein [Strongyloides ratti]|uniref:NUDIX hydrolase domain and NUDIX hydrolase domain-like-containing protein n=1 Tax=Strongyloides ratti TaxID=34506 RepID=A0A090LEP2_STRRB|nr:NUDIX hydrolase domain and NUDIX hydrolase domain-like-containing protein [Strongyloides ratti]CEF66623.1 NUDIX hydrolase domain and NUDIX hydrolase domain-like-containing protein [Strongyloides ratti]